MNLVIGITLFNSRTRFIDRLDLLLEPIRDPVGDPVKNSFSSLFPWRNEQATQEMNYRDAEKETNLLFKRKRMFNDVSSRELFMSNRVR